MALAASFSISLCGEKGGDAEWGCGCVFVQRASTARVAAPARRHMSHSLGLSDSFSQLVHPPWLLVEKALDVRLALPEHERLLQFHAAANDQPVHSGQEYAISWMRRVDAIESD